MTDESRHGGDIFRMSPEEREQFLDFSININPMGLSPKGKEALHIYGERDTLRYPDSECRDVVQALSMRYGLPEDNIVVGNGATELMYALMPVVGPKQVCIPAPSFSEYALSAKAVGIPTVTMPLDRESAFSLSPAEIEKKVTQKSLIYVGHPNNPDGQLLAQETYEILLQKAEATESTLAIDESFIDFLSDELSYRKEIENHPRLVILMSLTKFYAVPGLRIGCAFGNERLIASMRRYLIPWHVNGLAQRYMTAALGDEAYGERSRQFCKSERAWLSEQLERIEEIQVYPGTVNFILCRLRKGTVSFLQELLKKKHILIRNCGNYDGLDETFFRVAVRRREENEAVLIALREVLR